MRGDNSINTSSLAGRERARKVSEVRKKMVKFSNQKYSVYHCSFATQSRQHQSSAAQMAEYTKCARKGKRKKGGKEREKGGNNAGSNRKKKKKKKDHAHSFSHRDPCAMTFRECKKIWQCLIVKNNISTFSCLCCIPEVNIQSYPHLGCIF